MDRNTIGVVGGRGGIPSPPAFFESFRQCDLETLQIIEKAAKIVPKAYDILGISLSDSESDGEEDNDDAAVRGERSSATGHQGEHQRDTDESASLDGMESGRDEADDDSVNVDNGVQQNGGTESVGQTVLAATVRCGSDGVGLNVVKSRKRCASTPSTLTMGQSPSSVGGLRDLIPPTIKKRRLPSISEPSGLRPNGNSANHSNHGSGGAAGTRFQRHDRTLIGGPHQDLARLLDTLIRQLNQLDELEKAKLQLMQRHEEVRQRIAADLSGGGANALSTAPTDIVAEAGEEEEDENVGIALGVNNEELIPEDDIVVGATVEI